MMATLTTVDGDTADLIAYRAYGVTAGATEALLNANPGLAARGPVLPLGVVVNLPNLAPGIFSPPITRLWD